ncbi:MAG: hypothetical protein V4568_02480 [Pseudomonadota bacterium]
MSVENQRLDSSNTTANGQIINIKQGADIMSRPKFTASLNLEQHKLKAVIGQYSVEPAVPCGLSDCRKPHNRGYLILTEDDVETSIGLMCGRKYFGESFKAAKTIYDKQAAAISHKAQLVTLMAQRDEYLKRVDEITAQPNGARWLDRNIRRFAEQFPQEIVAAIYQRAERGQDKVFETRIATDEELQSQREKGVPESRLERYIREDRGALRGLRIFRRNIRGILIQDIKVPLDALDLGDVEAPSATLIKRVSNLAATIDVKFLEAEALLEEAKLFFDADNLDLLRYLEVPKSALRELEKMNWEIA